MVSIARSRQLKSAIRNLAASRLGANNERAKRLGRSTLLTPTPRGASTAHADGGGSSVFELVRMREADTQRGKLFSLRAECERILYTKLQRVYRQRLRCMQLGSW